MMNNVTIETLTYVHIGSGVFLQKGNDFIVVEQNGNSDVYIIDPNKLGAIIGTDPQTIAQWVAMIERGDADSFIKKRTAGHSPKEFSKRKISNFANFDNTQGTLKECLHDGMGRPYIPGSSIKGAIRTAVMASMARMQGKDYISQEINRIFNERDRRKREKKYNDIEKQLLGVDPNSDLFRFISVGDAFFGKSSEVSVKQINLNITRNPSLIDKRKQQIVEVIGPGENATFSLKIDMAHYNRVRNAHHRDLASLLPFPGSISAPIALFSLINAHTKKLVEEEIRYWNNEIDSHTGQEDYVATLEDILGTIKSCQPGECVIRLGQAIGWRFITGAWTEMLDDDVFYEKIVPVSRPFNEEKYKRFDFPKSRRIDDESYVFGFIKLACSLN